MSNADLIDEVLATAAVLIALRKHAAPRRLINEAIDEMESELRRLRHQGKAIDLATVMIGEAVNRGSDEIAKNN